MQNWTGESPQDFSPTQNLTDNQAKLGIRDIALPRKENNSWLSNAKESDLKT